MTGSVGVRAQDGILPGALPRDVATTATRPLALEDLALERGHRLPSEHPPQPHDAISLSSRARAQIAAGGAASPIAALTFWDHPVRIATSGSKRISLDPSASYRLV